MTEQKLEELSKLFYLISGETLQFFTATTYEGDVVETFVVDHSVFPSATSYLQALRNAKVDHPLFNEEYDYVRTAYQSEVDEYRKEIERRIMAK